MTERPDALDRRIIVATQAGLPLDSMPYHRLAERLGVSARVVQERLRAMLGSGRIRRIGAVPNHYRLGYVANGMSVWDVDDEQLAQLAPTVASLEFVSHCYERPRHPPIWPYNLFAMVHGRTREEVLEKVTRIADLLGEAQRAYTVLFSKRILKKTGLRLTP
ncbi:MAG: Lrp/AsnC family transcriptional regulator [Gammaproteobacteria bacterium]|nr:Lrp/AsnC family transcriptional regulator [Gammaproteobacteria bacterium]NIR83504.1 Lrp/AsnC family transcriptional regulator [Gammaproteobacteria bacterium]NIR91426.1 Lrp/AsnC family transcriptional regulator [Gammaproteobacteria bacterium]NIU04666.1 Lrp/AsnC family transcriptional regulator [Gammaproteobacteria bacterium]NIV51708.1 AsnC family transcriptional regulator [Gammaproteobacteria bacterium]